MNKLLFKQFHHTCFSFPLFSFRVMIHIVAQCHEEGLEHYLRSYVKVKFTITTSQLYFVFVLRDSHSSRWMCLNQFVFRTEPYTSSTTRTVHEELAKAMTAILKPSTDFLTSNKLLKVAWLYFSFFVRSELTWISFLLFSDWCPSALQYSWYFFEALVKSMAQYLIESCKVKVSLPQHVCLTPGVCLMTAQVVFQHAKARGQR